MDDRPTQRASRIGEVADLAHVTVRALRHYDRIGLLRPSGRSEAGYRLYTTEDLERLQTVLLYKELGFGLGEIRDLLAEPGFDRREALRAQRDQLAHRSARVDAMLAMIDKTLAAMDEGIPMERSDLFGVFGDFDPAEHEDEGRGALGRDGGLQGVGAAHAPVHEGRLDAVQGRERCGERGDRGAHGRGRRAGRSAGHGRGRAAPAAHRRRGSTPARSRCTSSSGGMYVEDARFAATYEKIRPGMAEYLRDATAANARRAG